MGNRLPQCNSDWNTRFLHAACISAGMAYVAIERQLRESNKLDIEVDCKVPVIPYANLDRRSE